MVPEMEGITVTTFFPVMCPHGVFIALALSYGLGRGIEMIEEKYSAVLLIDLKEKNLVTVPDVKHTFRYLYWVNNSEIVL